MKHRSKRLLATTCLSAAMMSSAFLPVSVLAQEYNAAPRKWGAHADIIGSTAHGESAAGVELFVPMLQNEDSIVFIDGSLNGDFDDEVYGSFGVGYRKLITPDLIIGGIVALDYTQSENGKDYGAVTLGAEAIGPVFEARVNVQLPFSDSRKVSETDGPVSDVGTVSLIDNRLVEQLAVGTLRIDEVPLTGVEGEVGVNLPIGFESLDDDLRVFAGAYHYSGDGVDDFTGVSGRVEYRVHDVLGEEIPGSDLILSAGATHDEERGTNFAGEIRLRVPLGAPPKASDGDGEYALSALERRMTDHVVRTRKIQTLERRTGSVGSVISEAVVIDATTGRPLDNIRFADGADTEGAGTLADPTTLSDAVADAGIGGVVVAQGGAGAINTSGVTLQNGQSLIGGGTAIPIRLADGTVTTFTLGTSIGTIVGAPTGNVVTLGQDNILRSLDIEGGLAGISGANVGTLVVDRVDISGSAGTGFQIANTSGTNVVGISGLSVSNVAGAGISIDGSGGGTTTITGFSGVSISGAGAGGAMLSGLTFDASTATAGFQRVEGGPLTISGVTGDGLALDGVAGDLAFTNLTIANTDGAGLFIRDAGGKAGSFAFGNTGGSITTQNGAAIDVDPVALSLRFATVSSTNAAGQGSGGDDGIFIDTITARDAGSAAVVIGSTTVTGAADDGIFVTNASGGVSFGTVLIDGVGGDGIQLVANNGLVAFGDTAISDPGGNGIDISGVNGQVTFGNVDITGLGAGTGLDLTDDGPSTRVALAFATLDITGTGAAGSIGIDYSGTTNTFDVTTTESGTISGVAVGVDLTGAAATGLFRYGDGSATDADGRASTIDAGQPLLVAGVDGSVGTYDFRDVNLVGDISNLAGLTVFYVDSDGGNDAGVTDGSADDPGTLAQAVASGADVIVLVDNQGGGAQDVIDAASVIQGVGGTLTLADDQRLAGFGASDTLDLGGGANVPINVLLTSIDANIITNTNPGSGAPLLTTTLALANTVALGSNNLIQGVTIDNGGGGAAVVGNGISGLAVRDSAIDSLSIQSASGSASLTNSAFGSLIVNGGSVAITGTNADISNAESRAALAVTAGHTGSLSFDAASTISATAGAGLVFAGAQGTYDFDGAVTASGTTNGISITAGASPGSFAFANATITNTTGEGLRVDGAVSLTLGGAITQSNSASAVEITNMASGSATISASVSATNGNGLQFDNVDGTVAFTGAVTLNGGDAGIDIVNGSSGSFTFANAAITDPSGTAFNLSGSNATVGYTGTITQTNAASAVAISNMTAGSVTFAGAVSASTGAADAIALSGNAGATIAFNGGLAAGTTTGTAFTATGGGTVRIAGTTGAETLGTSAGRALNLVGVTADIALDSITATGGATAVFVNATSGTLGVSGVVSATNATGDAISFSGNAATVSLGSVSVVTAAGQGLRREGSSGAFTVSGTTSIVGTAGAGININGNSGATSFGTTSVTGAGAVAIGIFDNTAQTTFGATTVATPAGDAIGVFGMNAGVSFGAVTISDLAAGAVGLNLNGAVLTGAVSLASLNLTGSGGTPPAGSIGIDLRGTTGAQTITVGTAGNPAGDTPSIISNVATGVFLDSATNANFTYGDGESSTDRASRLLSPTPIDAASAPTLGSYNFLDVDFQGANPGNGFGNATAYYFSATGTGSGATITDPGSVAGALASSASALVSLDDGSGNAIDVAGSTTFSLDASQQLLAFAAAGGTIDLMYTAPSTILISAVDIPVTDTVGNGSAALTNTAAGQSVVTLGSGNQLTNIVIDGSADAGIAGTGISGLVLDNVSISNTAGAGLALLNFGGALVSQNGLEIASTGGFGIDIAASAGATGAFGGLTTVNNATAAGGGVLLSDVGAFLFGGGLDIDTGAGIGFLATDGTIGVGGTSSISTATGAVIDWSDVAIGTGGASFASLSATGTVAGDAIRFDDVNGSSAFSGGAVSIAGTSGLGSDGIEISNGSAASFSFGAATIGATGGNGVNLNGANGAVSFASLSSTSAAGSGLLINGATANVTVTGNVTATGSGASGVTIANVGAASTVSLSGTTTVSGAGGAGLTVFQSAAGSTVSIASVAIDGSAQQGAFLNSNNGTVTISGGTIGATATNAGGLSVSGGTGAATVNADVTNSSGIGISASRPGGTTTINGTLSQTGSGTGVFLSNSGGTVSFTDTLTLNGTGGGLIAADTGGTFSFAAVSSTQTGAGSAVSITAASGSASYTFGGQVTADTSGGSAAAVSISGAGTPTVDFNGGLAIISGANTGFAASGGATLGVAVGATTRTITTTGGQAINWDGVDVAAGGAIFSSVTTGTVLGDAILFNDVDGAGTFESGTTSVGGTLGAGNDGIVIAGGSAANFIFGTTTIGSTGGDGIALGSGATGNSGTVSFIGVTTITNPGAAAVDIEGTNGAISFQSLQIALQTAGTTGLDLSGAIVGSGANVTATDFDLTATSGTGTIGVNLAGTTGAGTIRLGDTNVAGASASIAGAGGNTAGPAIGVQFSSATNTNFVFGDGEATTDIGSSIVAVTPVFATDSLPTNGSYNFLDVTLTGDTSALAGPTTYYVDQDGAGAGTFADPGSIGGAELSGADVIVLVDTNLNGTANLIDMAVQTSGGGANTLDLADGQVVISLANGESIDVATLGVSAAGAPSSFQFTGINASSVISAPLGSIDSARPILTTNNGPTINLAGSGGIARVIAANTDATTAGHAITGTFAAAERVILRSVEVDTAGGSGLYLRDGGQDISVDIAGFDADGGLRGLDIEGTSLATGGTGSITVTSLSGLVVDNGATAADGVRFDTVVFDADLATAGFQAVSGGSAVIGTTADRVQGNGLSFENVAGSLSFADLDIANDGGTGLLVQNSKANDFTLAVDAGDANNATVDTTNGTAIFLDPLTVNMIFDTVTSTNGVNGILLDDVGGFFRVTGATTVTGTSGIGVGIVNSSAPLTALFNGAVSIDNSASTGSGVAFTGNVAGSVANVFGELDVSTLNGAGVTASGSGTFSAIAAGSSITTTGTGNAVTIGAGGGTVSLGGAITKTGASGAAVDVSGRVAGSAVAISSAMGRTGGNATAVSISGNSGGTVTLSGATKSFETGTATAVSLTGNAGSAVEFIGGGLDIDTTSATGLLASGGGAITITGAGNRITTTTGTALSLSGVAVGSAGLAFDELAVTGAATGIALTSVTPSGGGAITLGTVNLQGITSRGIDVATALGAAVTVADLDIGLAGGSAVGLDFNGAALSAGFTANDFDLTSSSAGTTIGVDLRGVTGGQTIALGATSPASIAGVDTGVFLNSASNANFTFGDGNNTPTSSTITANFGIDASSAPAAGSYNFADVAFPGSPGRGFGVGRILFVDSDGATGGGTGSGNSAANAATLADAETASAAGDGDVFVLINNGNTINGGTNSLDLATNQQVRGFGNGAISLAITPVANITLSSNTINITDPTGNGGATLTAAAGAGQVITLGASGNVIDGFTLSGTGGATRGINDNGAGASNTLIDHMTVSGFSGAGAIGIEITPSTNTTIQNTAFSGNASNVLVNAAGTTIQNVTSSASTGTAFQINNATGTTTLSGITITGSGTGIAFGGTGATGPVNLTNVNISAATALSVTAGTGAFTGTNVDLTGSTSALAVSGGSNTMSFDTSSSITGLGGTAVSISGRTGGSFSFAGGVAVDGAASNFLSVSGATGANTVSFSGAVDVGQTTRALSGVAIDNNGTASTVSFANIDLDTSGTAFTASGGGTATVTTGTIDSTGAAASLNGIAANLTFTSTTSTGGTSNISLINTSGTAAFGAGALSGASGAAAFSVGSGTVSTTYAGSITYAGTGQLVAATSAHTGTLAFSGTLTATNGTGIAFDNADGTYNFSGTTVLNGGDAGIDIVNGSGGTITFGANTSITSPSGTGINVANSTASLTYSGNLTQANNAAAISIGGHSVGTLAFNTGTINATNGNGLQFDNADGTYTFAGTTTLNGGDAGIDIVNGSIGSFTFGTGTAITNNAGTGTAFNLSASNANVTYSGSIVDNAGYAVDIDGHDGGAVAFQIGSISANGGSALGIRVQNSNAGSVNFNGQTTLSTQGNAAVTLANNGSSVVGFNTTGNGLDIATTTGAGFSATGGGTVTVQGTGNTISSGTGTALTIANTTIGGTGVTFQSISANGGANGIVLDSTGASGGLTVTGDGGGANNGSGGTIQNSTGDGISLTSTANVRLGYMNIQNNLGDGIGGSTVNGFVLNRANITGNGDSATTDESGINIANLTGSGSAGANPTAITNSVISNNYEFEVVIANNTGTLTNLQLTGNTISSDGASGVHGNLVSFLGSGTSVMGLTVNGGSFTGNAPNTAAGIQAISGGTSMTTNISGATFTNNNAGVDISTNPVATTLTFNVSGNTFVGTRSTAINIFNNGNPPFNRTVNGTITGNTIGNGTDLSGSSIGRGIDIGNEGAVNLTVLIDSNIIQDIGTLGVAGSAGIGSNIGLAGQATGGGTTNLTITNNQISDIRNGRAILIDESQNTTGPFPTVFVNLAGNTIAGTIGGAAGDGSFIRLDQDNGTFRVTQTAATAGNGATELDNANGFTDPAKVSIGGTVLYGQGIPPLPTTNPLP